MSRDNKTNKGSVILSFIGIGAVIFFWMALTSMIVTIAPYLALLIVSSLVVISVWKVIFKSKE